MDKLLGSSNPSLHVKTLPDYAADTRICKKYPPSLLPPAGHLQELPELKAHSKRVRRTLVHGCNYALTAGCHLIPASCSDGQWKRGIFKCAPLWQHASLIRLKASHFQCNCSVCFALHPLGDVPCSCCNRRPMWVTPQFNPLAILTPLTLA